MHPWPRPAWRSSGGAEPVQGLAIGSAEVAAVSILARRIQTRPACDDICESNIAKIIPTGVGSACRRIATALLRRFVPTPEPQLAVPPTVQRLQIRHWRGRV